jgi:hypothetical protein
MELKLKAGSESDEGVDRNQFLIARFVHKYVAAIVDLYRQ